MDYIYDIVLNFQDEYYDFYEWKQEDKTKNIKKILLYIINNKSYLTLKYNDVIIDRKSLPKKDKIFLITNGMEAMGILINEEGKVIKKSGLLIDELTDITNNIKKQKKVKIFFKEVIKKKISYESRVSKERKKYINNFLSNIDKEKDKYLLKYLYHEIYNKEEENINKIYNELYELKNTNTFILYNSIKEKINYKKTN